MARIRSILPLAGRGARIGRAARLVAAGLAIAAPASAADRVVGLGRTYGDVQSAVDAAVAGDRILIHPGSYGAVTIGKSVTLQGVGGAGVTVLQASAGVPAVAVTAGAPTLRGLTLDGRGLDRALTVDAADATFEDSVLVAGLITASGGCAHLDGADVTLRRTTVTGCTANGDGGGLAALSSTVVLESVTLSDNVASDGRGGAVYQAGGSMDLVGTLVSGNLSDDLSGVTAAGRGGGLYLTNGGSTLISASRFEGNEARSILTEGGLGGAIRVWSGGALIIGGGTVFAGNVADERGSAIAVSGTTATVTLAGSRLIENVVDEPSLNARYGGALFCEGGAFCSVDRSWFQGNLAADGPAIGSITDLEVRRSMFCANDATDDAGAVDVGDMPAGSAASLTGNVFAGNDAGSSGGAVVLTGIASALINNHLLDNEAQNGGAIATAGDTGDTGLELVNNLFAWNRSLGVGTAVVELDLVDAAREGHGWYYGNSGLDQDYVGTSDTFGVDPLLVGGIATGTCDVSAMALSAYSPLRDAGDPLLLDVDLTPSDIGAFGGPDADLAAFLDGDGDGWPSMNDCADTSADRSPGEVEVCNGIDDDCDGLLDASDAAANAGWLFDDLDDDGVGGLGAWRCPTDALVAVGGDCDDLDPAVTSGGTYWFDADGDGYGDPNVPLVACGAGAWVADNDLDCDDVNPGVGPAPSWTLDADGDGFGAGAEVVACNPPTEDWVAGSPGDCDDSTGQVAPGAVEQCNLRDDDCDLLIDEEVVDVPWWPDADRDGYGDPSASPVVDCVAPGAEWAPNDGDCADQDPARNPGEVEVCGGGDEDCDALADDADPSLDPATVTAWYGDADQDGYGGGEPALACLPPGPEWSGSGDDCDDTDPAVHPRALETPFDGVDQDCDGVDAEIPADQDTDRDGMPDLVEATIGADPTDPDSDGDELLDGAEGTVDSDGDGLADAVDPDDDGDGIATLFEGVGDPDGDGIPNHLDLDSDGDGVNDAAEAVDAVLDPGGATDRRPRRPAAGCGCASGGPGLGGAGGVWGGLLSLLGAWARRRA